MGGASFKCFLLCWQFSIHVGSSHSLPEEAEIWPDEQTTASTEATELTVSLCPLKLRKAILT